MEKADFRVCQDAAAISGPLRLPDVDNVVGHNESQRRRRKGRTIRPQVHDRPFPLPWLG